jgi:class 3 adenylate cyclase
MALREDIKFKVNSILDERLVITDVNYVPKLDDPKLTFGNTGLKFTGSSLFIDIRGSTQILNTHNKPVVAKLHMAFFHTIVKIANSLNGNVRSFNGDSSLIFFQGNLKETLSTAVKCAMQIKYMIDHSNDGINEQLKKYSKLNFGIGIDHGNIICTKVGVGGEHNRDIFWIGNPVNKSTVLGNKSKSPNHIAISKYVYDNLLNWIKYGKRKNDLGQEEDVDIWTLGTFSYNGTSEYFYYTRWYWEI